MLDQNLHKNHLYSTFIHLLTIEQNIMITDIEVEVLHITTPTTKFIHKTDTVLHLEIDLILTEVLLLHNSLGHEMTLTSAIHGLTVLHTDLHIDLLIDATLVLDLDHALIQEKTTFQNIQFRTDHPLDQGILDILDPVHTPLPEIKLT